MQKFYKLDFQMLHRYDRRDRHKEMHCSTEVGCCTYIHNQAMPFLKCVENTRRK